MNAAGRTLASTLAIAFTTAPLAHANPGKVLVLQAEGRADGKTRAKVHAAVVKLAKTGGGQVSPGDITYADAAAAVGCKPEAAACKDEVIGMLSVDEIVIITVTPKPGAVEVAVHRHGKGGTKDARASVPTDKVDQLDALAPLFGAAAAAEPPPRPDPTPASTQPDPTPPPAEPPPGEPDPRPAEVAEPTPTPVPDPPLLLSPRDTPRDRGTLYMGGMAGSAALFVVGAVLWSKASGIQAEIDDAPTSTAADLTYIQDLESRGDSYAGWGNVLVIGGVVVGGISTYLWLRNRNQRRTATTATLAPVVFPGGAGLTFSLGGAR